MDATPRKSRLKLSCSEIPVRRGIQKKNELVSAEATPTTNNNSLTDKDNDYSPLYFPSTQELNEEIDVLWDWHSPQSSQRKRKKQKRLLPVQSPKFPLKRHPSNNQNQNFEKLRNELKALQEELAIPDDESCLCVSPQQEAEFKHDEGNNFIDNEQDLCDMFNDSVDEQLLLFSQRVENEIGSNNNKTNQLHREHNLSSPICDGTEIDNLINKYAKKTEEDFENMIPDEIFDQSSFCLEATTLSNIINRNCKFPLARTISDDTFSNNNRQQSTRAPLPEKTEFQRNKSFEQAATYNTKLSRSTLEEIERKRQEAKKKLEQTQKIKSVAGTVEFHRTKSFELAADQDQSGFSRSKQEEIERKKLEAKARLEAKKRQHSTTISPDEIEKKRLEAVAKREAKKLQEVMEKKRQEALKKLRMKNAGSVKSTLMNRLI